MNRERLLDVATVLEGVPDTKFDMRDWLLCGSVACAVGWYCQKRPDSGLELRAFGAPTIADEFLVGWPAVAKHFNINFRQAHHLFDSDEYACFATRAEVIARIRDFVASGAAVTP